MFERPSNVSLTVCVNIGCHWSKVVLGCILIQRFVELRSPVTYVVQFYFSIAF